MPRRKINSAPNISSESFAELIKILRATTVFNFDLSNIDSNLITVLFASSIAARETAYMLRGEWDGLNAVTIFQPDLVAIHNALALVKLELGLEEVEYCRVGECCSLANKGAMHLFEQTKSGKSKMLADFFVDARSLA